MKLVYSALAALVSAPSVLAADVFINEIHYDNAGGDQNEGIEIAGPAGTDVSGFTLYLYNGSSTQRKVYNTKNLSGVIPNQQDGFGTLAFAISGIQNGAPDGMALLDNNGTVLQFISYEGSFVALEGPVKDLTSIDIGVAETSSTPVGHSLQLIGSGATSDDFSWQPSAESSFGDVNANQTFGSGGAGADNAPEIIATSPANNTGGVAVNSDIEISFSESVNVVGDWFTINCAITGAHDAVVSAGPQHYQLDVTSEFAANEVCSVTVTATAITDVDANDPPDAMLKDYTFSFATRVNSPILINEVDADTAGSDKLEFVELFDGGTGNTALDGLVLVRYNGSDNRSYKDAISLDGFSTDSNGFFVIGNAAVTPTPDIVVGSNAFQNGADAVAIHAGEATDYPNDTPVSGFHIVDAIVYDTSDGDAVELLSTLTPNQDQINENGLNQKDDHANARVPDGGIALDTTNYLQQAPTPGSSNVPVLEIYEIQGSGMTSPVKDAFVASHGNIVTAIDVNGFFMQTPASRSDNNDGTSDGIYVFTGSSPAVAVGDEVSVTGKIVEFYNFTEFASGSEVKVTSSGNALPSTVTFDENTPSRTQPQPENEMERFEGMLVSFSGIVTAPTDRFGDAQVVAGTQRSYREPGIEYPGISGLPVWDGNPEIFEVNPDGLTLPNQTFYAGQSLTVTGGLGFSFGDYQVWPTSITAGPVPNLLQPVRQASPDEMTVGALNMYRPSQNAKDYPERLTKISAFVRNVMNAPDILAVSEVENIDVLQTVADQINSDDNSINYTPYLIEGNDIGGIDVGFLVRQSVAVDGVTQFGKETIFDYDGKLLNDRPPLLLEARVIADGSNFPIQVLAIHNRSLSSISKARVKAKRLAQAQYVAQVVQDIQAADPDVNLIVTGDFNAYQFTDGYVDVVGQIAGTSQSSDNLVWEMSPVFPALDNQVLSIPAEQQYSFIFGGSAQVLDHALTTQNLSSLVADFVFVRGNADAPANLVNDDSTALRASDHDGIVMFINKDSDNDSVLDSVDMCSNTALPETAPSKGLKKNHFALLDGDTWFDTKGNSKERFNLTDTAGCSCEQIVEQQGLGKGHLKHGCSVGVMRTWVDSVSRP